MTNVIGIYEIQCKKNNWVYVGKSKCLGLRWAAHLAALQTNSHSNKSLQEDFNKYGICNFTFSVLEVCSGEEALSDAEKQWIGRRDKSKLYNVLLTGSWNAGATNVIRFTEYINNKWLINASSDDLSKRIWKKKDKNEIRRKFWECRITRKPLSEITFNYVIKTMGRDLGYTIQSGRHRVKLKQATYKVIMAFDEERIAIGGT